MRDKIFFSFVVAILLIACSLNDVLKPSDEVHVIIMEAVDTVRPLPGDTISFKFLASVNSGSLKRVEIIDKTVDFDIVPKDAKFALVDQTQELSLDSNGYFSRPVSTVMVMFPMAIPKDPDIIGTMFGMTFRVTGVNDKTGTVSSFFKVGNCKTETSRPTIYSGIYNPRYAVVGYSSATNRTYNQDAIWKNKKIIDMFIYADAKTKKWYYMSPSSSKAIGLLAENNIKWDTDSIKTTHFVKMDKYNYTNFGLISDNELNGMDLSQAKDVIELDGVKCRDVIGYVTNHNRRCALSPDIYSLQYHSFGVKHSFLVKGEEEEIK